jgi:oxygen-independent coproporphyrinogen III oxidase
MVSAIKKEISLRKNEVKEPIKTIYFGGGTPSLLSSSQIREVLNTIVSIKPVSTNVEITLEANPEDLNENKLAELLSFGVNRLSIGVQSLNDDVLHWMNRNHTSQQGKKAIYLANKLGFKNISVDFIYGTPIKINRKWDEELVELASYPITHLSAYHLTIEPKTFFDNQLRKGIFEIISQEQSHFEYTKLVDTLRENQLNQYEVSNFAKEGYNSNHNMSYWQQKEYLGIGPSAHSYDGNSRRWNKSNNANYIKSIKNNEPYHEFETLSKIDKFNELIMVGLRTKKGFNLEKAFPFLNAIQKQQFNSQLKQLLLKKTIQRTEKQISMFEDNLMLAEYATRELFILKE